MGTTKELGKKKGKEKKEFGKKKGKEKQEFRKKKGKENVKRSHAMFTKAGNLKPKPEAKEKDGQDRKPKPKAKKKDGKDRKPKPEDERKQVDTKGKMKSRAGQQMPCHGLTIQDKYKHQYKYDDEEIRSEPPLPLELDSDGFSDGFEQYCSVCGDARSARSPQGPIVCPCCSSYN